jgi:4-hydroxymandelate oxidase
MANTPDVTEASPLIVERLGGRALITADGGVRSAYDVLKMFALVTDKENVLV